MVFSNLKIGRKLNLGFTVLVIFTFVLAVFSLYEMRLLWKETYNLYNHPFQVSNHVREIRANSLLIRLNLTQFDQNQAKEYLLDRKGVIDSLEVEIQRSFAVVEDRYLGSKDEVRTAQNTFSEYLILKQSLWTALQRSDFEEANLQIAKEIIPCLEKLDSQILGIRIFAMNKAETFYLNSVKKSNQAFLVTILIFVFIVLISIVIAFLIIRAITNPLKKLMINIQYLKMGSFSKQIDVESGDELGELALSLVEFQNDLVNKAGVAHKIANGEFNTLVKPNSENDELAHSINQIIENSSRVIDQAVMVSNGNFQADVPIRSENDKLGVTVNKMVVSLREIVHQAKLISNGDYSGYLEPRSNNDELAISINKMTQSLRDMSEEAERQNWIKTGLNELHKSMHGDLDLNDLSKSVITFLCRYLNAKIGTIYLHSREEDVFKLMGSFAFLHRKSLNNIFKPGEGIIGQAALEKEMIIVSNVPEDYIQINSALGEAKPNQLFILPFVFQGITLGVIELGKFEEFNKGEMEFLHRSLESLAIGFNSAINRSEMKKLLKQTQEQSDLLQLKQNEILQTNVELEEQTKALKRSEEHLQTQQEELRVINEELEGNSKNLQVQQNKLIEQNEELNKARNEIEMKAQELELTSKYKSEFLANMSHELRTPLNSLLILSQDFMNNRDGNLSNDQLESASIIYKSGNDLLNLINEILDLSKIESGKMEVQTAEIELTELVGSLELLFRKLFQEKGIAFESTIEHGTPLKIRTDVKRLEQILRNLVSNALKFTEEGKVSLLVYSPNKQVLRDNELFFEDAIAFDVIDTGIGIAHEMQQKVFEAFQQAEGGISRKYGGTGLGLSISRELGKLLGGKLLLKSSKGEGSVFTLLLPSNCNEQIVNKIVEPKKHEHPSPKKNIAVPPERLIRPANYPADDRNNSENSKPVLVIIEDDASFVKVLIDQCHRKGFNCIASPFGEEGLQLVEKYQPTAIILDINLPGIDGWTVLESLKSNSKTRHVPVHMMTAYESDPEAYRKGAIGFLTKPIKAEELESAFSQIQQFADRKVKELLIVEDDENMRQTIKKVIGQEGLRITVAKSGKEAKKLIVANHFDCVVLDLGLPDISGFELLENLERENIKVPPVIIYTGRELSGEENMQLQHFTGSIIVKGVKSEERLLDESALFLHRVIESLPERQKHIITNLYDKDRVFRDRKVLVVDDDMRNVFAITKVLEQNNMVVYKAENGIKALALLDELPLVDIVLMDIMMPIMDGFETMQQIRKNPKFKNLPIIALTAKAMREDQARCIEAGANDYLAKPIDIDKLFNMMRVWLYQ